MRGRRYPIELGELYARTDEIPQKLHADMHAWTWTTNPLKATKLAPDKTHLLT